MTQTMNGKKGTPEKKTPANTAQRLHRPGQRQQERLQRLARRRRRQRIWTSVIVSLVVIAVSIFSIVEINKYNADKAAAAQASANATATKLNHIHATATASAVAECLSKIKTTPTPKAGPAKPPAQASSGTPVKLADGLEYIDVQVGCGPAAKSGSTVSVEYTGWLQKTGAKFDSSYDRQGQPLSVTLGQGQVIKGFDEGLVGLKKGGTRILIIPPALAYGAQGQGPIPPNATLIFEVTALSVS